MIFRNFVGLENETSSQSSVNTKSMGLNNMSKRRVAWNKGIPMGEEQKKKIGRSNHLNSQWKGDKVKYGALHAWVRRRLKKPNVCEHCKKIEPRHIANKTGKYIREIGDWLWLCSRCHIMYDNGFRVLQKITIFKEGLKPEIFQVRMTYIQYLNGEVDFHFTR